MESLKRQSPKFLPPSDSNHFHDVKLSRVGEMEQQPSSESRNISAVAFTCGGKWPWGCFVHNLRKTHTHKPKKHTGRLFWELEPEEPEQQTSQSHFTAQSVNEAEALWRTRAFHWVCGHMRAGLVCVCSTCVGSSHEARSQISDLRHTARSNPTQAGRGRSTRSAPASPRRGTFGFRFTGRTQLA